MVSLFLFSLLVSANAVPVNLEKKTENDLKKQDEDFLRTQSKPKLKYATYGDNISENEIEHVEFKTVSEDPTIGSTAKVKSETTTTSPQDETTEMTTLGFKEKFKVDPIVLSGNEDKVSNRTARQEEDEEKEENGVVETNKEENGDNPNESQEEEEEEEEENMITGLISAFLGGLSRPDGSIDVEAITGLLGSLSTQREDGTYEFGGLTELLQSFFGGEGGSDVGAFISGITGALLQGLAQPPGAQGIGAFLGRLVGGILPGLSAPAPTEEGEPAQPQPAVDSGGFLSGFLSSFFGGLGPLSSGISGGSGGGNKSQGAGNGGGSKYSIFKAVFSLFTSILSSSSSKQH